jgi:hypothetical protein
MEFMDWSGRPAVLLKEDAYAVLRPGGPWTLVDWKEVANTGGVLTEATWRRDFGHYGRLDLSKIPCPSPSSSGASG